MPVPAKNPPRVVMYRGAKYELEAPRPPREVIYQGVRYVLAAEDAPFEERGRLKGIEIDIPKVVFAYNYFPAIKTFIDPLVSLISQLEKAYKQAMFQKENGLKLIVDAGYDVNLAALLNEDNVEYIVDIMDGFLDSFATVDAISTVISSVVEKVRKEVLGTEEFKELLGGAGSDTYNRLYNSALSRVGNDIGTKQLQFVAKVKQKAKEKEQQAKENVKRAAQDPDMKDRVTETDGRVKTKSSQ